MTGQPYEIDLTRTARRALAERLPLAVVIGASEFINGPLADDLRRVGKELDRPSRRVFARVMQEWRLLYVIDETQHRVTIRDIGHRRDTYRPH